MIKKNIKFNLETSLYLLLFLFPLFAIGVRHWSSITFSLLIILGLVYYFSNYKKNPVELHKYEKIYLWFLVAYFVVFLLSMMLHYPASFGDTEFGNEVRFILVIPLYLLLSKTKHGLRWLAYGAVVSIVISFGFCVYDLYIIERPLFHGEYSQLFTGPIILIYLTLVMSYFVPRLTKHDKIKWGLLAVLVIIATFSIVSTQVRSAYIGYLLVSLFFVVLFTKGWLRVVILSVLVITLIIISIYSESVNSRMSKAINEVVEYIETSRLDPANKAAASSAGARLEMWRASSLFIKDYPLLGVGNGNYQSIMKGYADQGLVHVHISKHGHPHNVFVNGLMTKGLLGLLCTCLVFFFPLAIYIKTFRFNEFIAKVGILYVTVMFLISMSEAAPFNKSNFVATYLILSLVIFQNHMQAIKKNLAT